MVWLRNCYHPKVSFGLSALLTVQMFVQGRNLLFGGGGGGWQVTYRCKAVCTGSTKIGS